MYRKSDKQNIGEKTSDSLRVAYTFESIDSQNIRKTKARALITVRISFSVY